MTTSTTHHAAHAQTTTISARWRIVGWIVLTTALALLATTITMRSVLLSRVADDANAAILQEIDEFRLFAEGEAGEEAATTSVPHVDTMAELMEVYLRQQTPATGEAIISVAGDQVLFSDNATSDAGEKLANDSQRIQHIMDSTDTSGIEETDQGQMRWGKVTAQTENDPAEGTLIVVQFVEDEIKRVNRQVVLLFGVAAGGLLLTAGIAWLVAGRIMQPIRTMREAAETLTVKDLSARVPVEGQDDISQLAVTLNSLLDRLEAAYAAQRHFTAEAQQLLDGPRAEVSRAIEILARSDTSDPERERAARVAEAQLALMHHTLADLEILSERDNPSFVRPARTSLKEITAELYADAVSAHGERTWELEKTATGHGWLDAHRIGQAVDQLVENAVAHTRPGETMRIGSELLTEETRTVRFWVWNPGPALDDTEARAIFETYRSEAGTDESSGMGLGLAVVRAIAEAHHGNVWVESGEGMGTRFGMDLPLEALRPEEETAGSHLEREIHQSMQEES